MICKAVNPQTGVYNGSWRASCDSSLRYRDPHSAPGIEVLNPFPTVIKASQPCWPRQSSVLCESSCARHAPYCSTFVKTASHLCSRHAASNRLSCIAQPQSSHMIWSCMTLMIPYLMLQVPASTAAGGSADSPCDSHLCHWWPAG
jgi:hypothetical protein